jgi:hypothetical protein
VDLLIDDDRATAPGVDGHMFKFVDELDLMRAQYAMIDLAFHCLTFVDGVRFELKKEYYEILSQIFMRDELRLSNLALGQIMEDIEYKIKLVKEDMDVKGDTNDKDLNSSSSGKQKNAKGANQANKQAELSPAE